jgi:hypothetical protein
MTKIYNPSMQEEPYNHPTRIIPSSLRGEETILGWLERSGRFFAQEVEEGDDRILDDFVDEIIESEAYQVDEYDNDDDEDDL